MSKKAEKLGFIGAGNMATALIKGLIQSGTYENDQLLASDREKDAFSLRRLVKYFVRPRAINVLKFIQVIQMGLHQGVLFPRRGEAGVHVDNRKLDGFLQSLPPARQVVGTLDEVCDAVAGFFAEHGLEAPERVAAERLP